MQCVPYRLVRHELPKGAPHLDLFLLIYAKEFLYSYEIEAGFEEKFIQKKKKKPKNSEVALWGILSGDTRGLETASPSLAIEAKQGPNPPLASQEQGGCSLWNVLSKPRHRLHYWSYSGPIPGERGLIKNLGYGKFFYDPEEFDLCSFNWKLKLAL